MRGLKNIQNSSEGLYKELGSKFIAYLHPIKKEEEVKGLLLDIQKKHHKARHFCYAFRLGEAGELYRLSDDGEPSGTAGLPIFNQLKSFEVTGVLLCVVRYFGGTKLGKAGLVRAYKESAKDALLQAQFVRIVQTWSFKLAFEYDQLNEVMAFIERYPLTMLEQNYGSPCVIALKTELEHKQAIVQVIDALPGVELKKMPIFDIKIISK